MVILITGGAGFIGHTLARQLLVQGHTVLLVDNFNHCYNPVIKWRHIRDIWHLPNWSLYQGDIRDADFLNQIFRTHTIDCVVHLAGMAGVRASLKDPSAYFDHNVNGTAVLLDTMHANGIKRLVFASSSSVYGIRSDGQLKETDSAEQSVSPYALSKRKAERLCHRHHHLYGLDVFCLRLFTVYGPHQRPDMAISRFIRHLHTGQPIHLFGTGHSQRDYTYIDDVVAGISQAIVRVKGYEIINLGSANPVTLLDLMALLERITGRHAPIEWVTEQAGDVPYTHAAIEKARQLLDYYPATRLEDGLQRTVASFQQTHSFTSALDYP